MADEFCLKMPDFHVTFRDLLYAVNLLRGTDGFTSPPKEGVLMGFSPWKIQRLRSGSNPRTLVPKASTLRLDQRSRLRLCLCVCVCVCVCVYDRESMREITTILYSLSSTALLILVMKSHPWVLTRRSMILLYNFGNSKVYEDNELMEVLKWQITHGDGWRFACQRLY